MPGGGDDRRKILQLNSGRRFDHTLSAESVNAEHAERELPSAPNRPERRQTPTCNEVIEGPRPERDVLRNIKIIFCKDVLHRKKMLRDRKVGSGS